MKNIVIASSKKWFSTVNAFKDLNNYKCIEIHKKEDLSYQVLKSINPQYIFFPHWSWKVLPEIYNNFECILFHTAPLPYGRGGSPIQNLILNGFKKAPVCALRMTEILDGGPIYLTEEVSLDGNLDEIFIRLSKSIQQMIIYICERNPKPTQQNGKVVKFDRLSPKDNEIVSKYSIDEIYNRIRMVDGQEYPRAYINFGQYRIELSNAEINGKELTAKIKIFINDN